MKCLSRFRPEPARMPVRVKFWAEFQFFMHPGTIWPLASSGGGARSSQLFLDGVDAPLACVRDSARLTHHLYLLLHALSLYFRARTGGSINAFVPVPTFVFLSLNHRFLNVCAHRSPRVG